MKFCPECDNFLIPRKMNRVILYCKFCGKSYEIDIEKDKKEYIISHKKKKTTMSKDIFAKKSKRYITDEDRRAFEDYIFEN